MTVTIKGAKGGKATLKAVGSAISAPVNASGVATFRLPSKLTPGKYKLTTTYANGPIRSKDFSTVITVQRAPTKITAKVTKKVSPRKRGQLAVVATAPGTVPTGTVSITLRRAKSKKAVKATLVQGRALIRLPKLKKGKWKATMTYTGSSKHQPTTTTLRLVSR